MQTWLMKSEPSEYSMDDLARDRVSSWFGVRNYQARNFMRDHMQIGDRVLFYHSSCAEVGIAGMARVESAATPDQTQFDPKSPYYDPKATIASPRWFSVDVAYVQKFPKILPLSELRAHPELATLVILKPGNRLSITPITEQEWSVIQGMIPG